ncbi:hypothetical protein [Peribacillus loiseleuriae]|uniref:Pectate lyase superfamily protein domain-containing protein n=1 Tax=Peribacillus loiseleuriae TaxID=1679170 RepID=A0A0K9GWL2_9BACI|nr:hypothetical protein [Peribacillus loiseleuriae]KMY51030.1 hypothetical protein AC625_17095 [Peribacillus loiseleuriae]
MKKVIGLFLCMVFVIIVFYQQNHAVTDQKEKIYVEDFKGANDSVKIQAAIDKSRANKIKTVMLDDKKYRVTSPIIVRQGVKLLSGYGTEFIVEGNFRVFELEKNASIEGAYIAINDADFNSEVIYLDGKYKYYNTWYKTHVKDINIVNWSESNQGTGISLYAGGKKHEISFVNFENVKVSGMETGVKLIAEKPASGYAWINANRFMNVSLEDCVNMIYMDSHSTIPNETSGNQFTNLQIQPSSKTKSILKVSGEYNEFDGMAWDLDKITHQNAVIEFTEHSKDTTIDIPSIPMNRISDNGQANKVNQ